LKVKNGNNWEEAAAGRENYSNPYEMRLSGRCGEGGKKGRNFPLCGARVSNTPQQNLERASKKKKKRGGGRNNIKNEVLDGFASAMKKKKRNKT